MLAALPRRRNIALLALASFAFFIAVHLRSAYTLARLAHDHAQEAFPVVHEELAPVLPWSPEKDVSEADLEPDQARHSTAESNADGLEPANATLGFSTILAVSKPNSPRQASLAIGANLTGIDIVIPSQPTWTDADIAAVRANNGSTISRGSALAWLGHLNALKWFLSTNLPTALILEDDVDWDIHLRRVQIPPLASALRKLLSNTEDGSTHYSPLQMRPIDMAALRAAHAASSAQQNTLPGPGLPPKPRTKPPRSPAPPSDQTYWGPPSAWEILYLGHCGDFFPATQYTHNLTHATVHDGTLPPHESLHPNTASFLATLHLPPHTRLVHTSQHPLCTFAYGVTRASAARMLADLSQEEENRGTVAWDVRLLEACRDRAWACWSVTPEVFHHVDEYESEIGAADERPAPIAGELRRAPNIGCGARSPEFVDAVGRGGERVVRYVREMAGKEGACGREEVGSWGRER
ncbi:hypothetical protein EJ06DRAFT_554569 [Trichodelitschia bisporula]|uniref:Glycosyltransferase family 25 protein n=1 Tax=Trichodelitschia bisporula TaxID=703511 RepID=A0A6G1I435_9PEZI|nr:hypothetical protein EJ06DRAFT_554569 [Trichodelitschia bisporula]